MKRKEIHDGFSLRNCIWNQIENSVSGYEEVQWKERKFTMGSVSGYQGEHWKERKFTMDSVSEVVSEIKLKINKIHATFSFRKWKNAIKRKKIHGGFSAWEGK